MYIGVLAGASCQSVRHGFRHGYSLPASSSVPHTPNFVFLHTFISIHTLLTSTQECTLIWIRVSSLPLARNKRPQTILNVIFQRLVESCSISLSFGNSGNRHPGYNLPWDRGVCIFPCVIMKSLQRNQASLLEQITQGGCLEAFSSQ